MANEMNERPVNVVGGLIACENCDDGTVATMTVVITNSGSAANVGYGCDDCTFNVFDAWWRGLSPEWEGLEIKRLRMEV